MTPINLSWTECNR